MPGNANGYPAKDETADYLERYAKHFELPVLLQTEVYSLQKTNGWFHAVTSKGEYRARQVVAATGPFQQPRIPAFAANLSEPSIRQLHTSQYANSASLQPGPVLIVGAGNSGAQIAVELSQNREVLLAAGHRLKFMPLQLMGRSIFWWLDKLGALHAGPRSPVGKMLKRQGDPIFGNELRIAIQQRRIKLLPRVIDATHDAVIFSDGRTVSVPNMIWATGFHQDFRWIRIPGALNDNGLPIHRDGVSPVHGLYFLGSPWQRSRASTLICGAGKDAAHLKDLICR